MSRTAADTSAGQNLDLLLAGGSVVGLGDGPLLDRVLAGDPSVAEAAFAALVRRHGAMVARVCGGIVGDPHAAEDAAQAVFLVLVRRAGSIRNPDRLAPWLYGVALRTAREARTRAARHRRLNQALPPLEAATMIDPTPDPAHASIRREQAELLHDAIARLPRRYLDPVVLCDLEGLTHAEAAARLDCPTATVSVRLKRAREQLRTRLARHRLDFETALPPLLGTAAPLPRTMIASTAAHLLANRVAWTLAAAKWQAAMVVALVAGVAAVGVRANQQNPVPTPGTTSSPANPPLDRPDPAQSNPGGTPTGPLTKILDSPPQPQADPAPEPPAPNQVVGLPIVREVRDYEEYIGRVVASRTVEVRSRISGVITSTDVAEGDSVQEGQSLFRIEDKENELENRIQTLQQSRAMALKKVQQIQSITKGSGDPALTQAQNEADRFAKSLINAESSRPFVPAPFTGQVTRRSVDVGASVEAGKTPLATVSTVDPILVDFEVDERSYLKIWRWLRSKPGMTYLPVQVALADEEGFPHPGRVLFRAARFSPETGTCTMHAELPNADGALIPGLFARVRVEHGEPREGLFIPERALMDVTIGADQVTASVWVLDADETIQGRTIELLPQIEGLVLVAPARSNKLWQVVKGIDARTRLFLDAAASGRTDRPSRFQ